MPSPPRAGALAFSQGSVASTQLPWPRGQTTRIYPEDELLPCSQEPAHLLRWEWLWQDREIYGSAVLFLSVLQGSSFGELSLTRQHLQPRRLSRKPGTLLSDAGTAQRMRMLRRGFDPSPQAVSLSISRMRLESSSWSPGTWIISLGQIPPSSASSGSCSCFWRQLD